MTTPGHRLPWDGYHERQEDTEFMDVLRNAATALQSALRTKGIASALIGGTALRLADGLPRLSRDLDLKVTRASAGSDQVVIDSVNSAQGWNARPATEADEEEGLEGIVITNEHSGARRSTSIDLIPGSLGGPDKDAVVADWVCERGGIVTYPTHILARLKVQTLIGERPRQLPHDVFDIAWLMHTHGYLVPEGDRKAIVKWIAKAQQNEQDWIARFQRDQDKRWKWHATIAAMREGLSKSDEIASETAKLQTAMRETQRRTGDARLSLEVNEYEAMEANIRDGRGKTLKYGPIKWPDAVAYALGAFKGLDNKELPERVRELKKEIEIQRQLARAKSR